MDELDIYILKSIIHSKKTAIDFCSQFDENIFISNESKLLGKAFINYVRIYKSNPTLNAINQQYSTNEDLTALAEDFWATFGDDPHDESDYNFNLNKLKNRYKQQKLNEIQLTLSNVDNIENNIKVVKAHLSKIETITSKKVFERKTIKDYLPDFSRQYLAKQKDPDVGRGILTGYSFLDYIQNGVKSNDLIVIAGETGSGKSILLNNMAIQMWMQQNKIETPPDQFTKGYNIAYVSLEMSKEDCFQRTMARLADVPSYGLRDANLSKAELLSLRKTGQFIKNYPNTFEIIDVPRGLTVQQLETILEDIRTSYNPDVIFVDYLTLMDEKSTEATDEDWLKLDKLAGKLHEFTRVYDIPIITALQLNRLSPADRKDDNKRIGLHRIGRSSQMANHCTLILQIDSRINEESYSDFVYHVIKNRHGENMKSHSVYKDFSRCSIIDKPYDVGMVNEWTQTQDISKELDDIGDLTKLLTE